MSTVNQGCLEKIKQEAEKIENEIIAAIKSGQSFRVEAGAGAGKTYSLNKVINWIQKEKFEEFHRDKKFVACITYTNTAVEVIKDRLTSNSFIIPSTIHSFAWDAIKQYQIQLIKFSKNKYHLDKILRVDYSIEKNKPGSEVYNLSHNDVIEAFSTLLDHEKFRNLFSRKYPIILIDEYQDSSKILISKFVEHFISKKTGPIFGFFGDSWQTIYDLNLVCGEIEHENLKIIKKIINYRSAPRIVEVLNFLRPNLPQYAYNSSDEGEVLVIANNFCDNRNKSGYYKDDLVDEEIKTRLDKLTSILHREVYKENESSKVLMITHKRLAMQQGYSNIANSIVINRDDDPVVLFVVNYIEPVYEALYRSDSVRLFELLKIRRYPVLKKSDKTRWKQFFDALTLARKNRLIDVLKVVFDFGYIQTPDKVIELYQKYQNKSNELYGGKKCTIKNFFEIEYSEFEALNSFFSSDSLYSTEHGVKGEEYDNIIYVIGKGWRDYDFEKYMPYLCETCHLENKDFIRNRNLFYVCCSRAKKRLLIFITTLLTPSFKQFLINMVGEENIIEFNDYINSFK